MQPRVGTEGGGFHQRLLRLILPFLNAHPDHTIEVASIMIPQNRRRGNATAASEYSVGCAGDAAQRQMHGQSGKYLAGRFRGLVGHCRRSPATTLLPHFYHRLVKTPEKQGKT